METNNLHSYLLERKITLEKDDSVREYQKVLNLLTGFGEAVSIQHPQLEHTSVPIAKTTTVKSIAKKNDKPIPLDEETKCILEFIKEQQAKNGFASFKEIIEFSNKHKSSTANLLSKLVKARTITKIAMGKYVIPSKIENSEKNQFIKDKFLDTFKDKITISSSEMSRLFPNLSSSVINYRFTQLMKKGEAERISRGLWKYIKK